METVIPTTGIFNVYKKLAPEPTVIDDEVKRQQEVAELSGDTRFETYKVMVKGMIDSLDARLQSQLDPKDTAESIGFRFLAVNLCKQYLTVAMNLPEAIAHGLEGTER